MSAQPSTPGRIAAALGVGALVGTGAVLGAAPAAARPTAQTGPARAVVAIQPRPVLGPGDEGPAVERWQERLNAWIDQEAARRGTIEVTGAYDDATWQATVDLQQNLDVRVDGLVGPETRAALDDVIGPLADEAPSEGDVPAIDPTAPLLGRGAVGPSVEDWQRQLDVWRRDAGLDAIATDAVFGPVTENATRQFQAAQPGAHVDGIVGPVTRSALAQAVENDRPPEQPDEEPPADGPSGPLLDVGSIGPAVTTWQETLNAWRSDVGITPIAVDAVYGTVTEDATRQFQAAQDALAVDGIVGPDTRAVAAEVVGTD
ncbi:MAG: peptidoglycan-binding protein [Acidimicrobiales bacterium]|nr:peptidoglycan-binding protein [Acidimicrobiales bacterium]